ncbi:MAG: O-antigen polysaccharide polymerase Wzy [bacterium]
MDKYLAVAVLMAFYPIWLLAYSSVDTWKIEPAAAIILLSWVGIFELAGAFCLWRRKTGKWFSLFSLFLMFFAAFNFGQCFLWALNIHGFRGEIGAYSVYGTVLNDDGLILRGQLAFIIALPALNCGAILAWHRRDSRAARRMGGAIDTYADRDLRTLFIASLLISVVVVPGTLLDVAQRLILRRRFSYHDLYYGNIASSNFLTNISNTLFLSALLGMLIGGRYKKPVRRVVYAIFLVYAVITLLTGDRGEWVNKLLVLVWADRYFGNRHSRQKTALYAVLSVILVPLVSAIVSVRNTGFSIQGFTQGLRPIEYSFLSMLAEFGNTMRVTMIVIRDNTVSPYGNTYLMSILTVFGTNLANRLFGIEYKQLHTWFSADYLRISSGADFSIIAEAILNHGVYVMPLVMLLLGMAILRLSAMPYRQYRNPLYACIAISIMNTVFKCVRSTMWYGLNKIVFIVICMTGMFYCVRLVENTRKRN